MLILSRRADESIVIGDEVVITILSVKGKQVRVGITAPSEVSVHREEIYQRLQSGEGDASVDVPASQSPNRAPATLHAVPDAGADQAGVNGNVKLDEPDDLDIDDNAGNH